MTEPTAPTSVSGLPADEDSASGVDAPDVIGAEDSAETLNPGEDPLGAGDVPGDSVPGDTPGGAPFGGPSGTPDTPAGTPADDDAPVTGGSDPVATDEYAQGRTAAEDGAERTAPAGEDYAGSGF